MHGWVKRLPYHQCELWIYSILLGNKNGFLQHRNHKNAKIYAISGWIHPVQHVISTNGQLHVPRKIKKKTKEEESSPWPDYLVVGLNPQNVRKSGLGPCSWWPSGLCKAGPRLSYPGRCQSQSWIFPEKESPILHASLACPGLSVYWLFLLTICPVPFNHCSWASLSQLQLVFFAEPA